VRTEGEQGPAAKPSGLQVSYRKAVEALTEQLTPKPPEGLAVPRSFIEAALTRALSPRQRHVLEQRERAA
jgi:hypothetical protein